MVVVVTGVWERGIQDAPRAPGRSRYWADWSVGWLQVAFRTCAEERERVVFQMGTADPARAVLVAKLVQHDVFGIDVNMGCPKPFSVKGGMGSALLRRPDDVRSILTALVQGLPHKPITCKIRLLPTFEETLALCELIQSTGVVAVGIHGRFTEQAGGPVYLSSSVLAPAV